MGWGWGGGGGVVQFCFSDSKYLNFGTFWVVFFYLKFGIGWEKECCTYQVFFFYSVGILFDKISKFSYNEKIKLYKQKNCSNTEHNQNQVMIITILH